MLAGFRRIEKIKFIIQRPLIRPCGGTFPPLGGRLYLFQQIPINIRFWRKETLSKPVSFSLLEKERFLESREKGAPWRVRWFQIGIRRPGFTPPLWSGPVHGGLPGRNRENRWSYPTFFRRLRRWGSERGAADWYSLYRGMGFRLSYLFTLHFSLFLFFVGRDDSARLLAPSLRELSPNGD